MIKIKKPEHGILIIDWHAIQGKMSAGGYYGIKKDIPVKLFKNKYKYTIRDITNFIGVVHALMFLKKEMEFDTVWTMNPKVVKWIKNQECKTIIEETPNTIKVCRDRRKALMWIHEQRPIQDVKLWIP